MTVYWRRKKRRGHEKWIRTTDAAPVIAEYLKDHPENIYYGDEMYNWKWEYMQENNRMNQPVTLRTFNLSYLHAQRVFSEK